MTIKCKHLLFGRYIKTSWTNYKEDSLLRKILYHKVISAIKMSFGPIYLNEIETNGNNFKYFIPILHLSWIIIAHKLSVCVCQV